MFWSNRHLGASPRTGNTTWRPLDESPKPNIYVKQFGLAGPLRRKATRNSRERRYIDRRKIAFLPRSSPKTQRPARQSGGGAKPWLCHSRSLKSGDAWSNFLRLNCSEEKLELCRHADRKIRVRGDSNDGSHERH